MYMYIRYRMAGNIGENYNWRFARETCLAVLNFGDFLG